jgi:hypothetical protein
MRLHLLILLDLQSSPTVLSTRLLIRQSIASVTPIKSIQFHISVSPEAIFYMLLVEVSGFEPESCPPLDLLHTAIKIFSIYNVESIVK